MRDDKLAKNLGLAQRYGLKLHLKTVRLAPAH